MKKNLSIFLAILFCIFITSCNKEKEEEVEPITLEVSEHKTSIIVGESLQLVVTITPDAAIKTVSWLSSDNDVATVDTKGKVVGIGAGEVTITVVSTVKEKLKKNINIVVEEVKKEIEPISLEVTGHIPSLVIGQSMQLGVSITPKDASKTVTWSSSDENIASVDQNGKVVAIGAGEVIITVKSTVKETLSESVNIIVEKGKEDLKTHEKILRLYNNTIEKYMIASNVNIYMEINQENNSSAVELVYNLNGFNLNGLKYISLYNDEVYEAYVKDDIQYVNYNGSKTKNTVDSITEENLIINYNFLNITEKFLNVFDNGLLDGLTVLDDKDGVVILYFDFPNYVPAEETGDQTILNNIKEVKVYMTYQENEISKIRALFINDEDKSQELILEFKGSEFQNIEYPDDLLDY